MIQQQKALAAEKLTTLKNHLEELGSLAVAFSGGVDSTFLAAVAQQVLGDRALAVTALSPLYPEHEQVEAVEIAAQLHIPHVCIDSDELGTPGFAENPPDRCYFCKMELFVQVRQEAECHGIAHVADGTTCDDSSDYRPGRRAARECNVLSPLLDAGLSKDEIRLLSREMALPTADKPAFACLASRFPYGSRITEDKLQAVESLETVLREQGFRQFRVRHHGDTARIEVEACDIERLCSAATRAAVVKVGKAAGFAYVTVDLEGYRTGSMNEVLKDADKAADKAAT